MTLRIEAFARASELLERAEPFLRERELEHNLALAILEALPPEAEPRETLLLVLNDAERCAGVALMRPGQPLVATHLSRAAAEALAAHLRRSAIDVRRIHTPEPGAGWLALALAGDGSAPLVPQRELIIYGLRSLAELSETRSSGRARRAEPPDAPQLATWIGEFAHETGFEIEAPEEIAKGRIQSGRAYVYEVAGRLVSMACIGGHARGLSRVGPVYTPSTERGRGYASALVGWVTRAILERGDQACLYADAANPSSNRVYLRLGYREIARVSDYERPVA